MNRNTRPVHLDIPHWKLDGNKIIFSPTGPFQKRFVARAKIGGTPAMDLYRSIQRWLSSEDGIVFDDIASRCEAVGHKRAPRHITLAGDWSIKRRHSIYLRHPATEILVDSRCKPITTASYTFRVRVIPVLRRLAKLLGLG